VEDGGDGVRMTKLLNNNKNSEFCAPLTSFDWNDTDPNIIGTSSIDTTCTIWNVETGQAFFFLNHKAKKSVKYPTQLALTF
jgi:WD40 repeat protein